jgi:integrase
MSRSLWSTTGKATGAPSESHDQTTLDTSSAFRHDLRHGVATELARSGASPLATSRMLGHAWVAFTRSVYQHADDEMVDLAAARLAEALGVGSA